MIDWPVVWLTDLFDWLIGRVREWVMYLVISGLNDWLIDPSFGWLVCLIGWLIGRVSEWVAVRVSDLSRLRVKFHNPQQIRSQGCYGHRLWAWIYPRKHLDFMRFCPVFPGGVGFFFSDENEYTVTRLNGEIETAGLRFVGRWSMGSQQLSVRRGTSTASSGQTSRGSSSTRPTTSRPPPPHHPPAPASASLQPKSSAEVQP